MALDQLATYFGRESDRIGETIAIARAAAQLEMRLGAAAGLKAAA